MWMRFAVPGVFLLFLLLFLILRKKSYFSILCRVLCLALTIWKAIEYALTPLVPTELSHLSYLLLGLSFGFFIRPFYFGAGALSLFSAVGYLLGVIISPNIFLHNMSLPIVLRGIFTHGLLFFLSLYALFYGFKVRRRDIFFPILFAAAVLFVNYLQLEGYISIPYFDPNGKAMIMILDGSLLSYVFDSYTRFDALLCQLSIYAAFILLFYLLNRLSYRASTERRNLIV